MNEEHAKVLIVADEWEPMQVLSDHLQAEGNCSVTCIEQSGPDLALAQFEAIFVYVHRALEAHVEDALIDYTLDGGRLIVLHHAIASAKVANPKWLDFLGIYIAPRDDPEHPWRVVDGTHTVVNLQPNHYITSHQVTYDRVVKYVPSDGPSISKEYPAFDLENTEVFLNQHFTDGREKTVLFGFRIADPESSQVYMQDRSGWYKRSSQGWIFYLQPGHPASDFADQNFGQIVLNCLRWNPNRNTTTGEDTAASVQLSPQDEEQAQLSPAQDNIPIFLSEAQGWQDISPGPTLEGWQEHPWPPGNQDTSHLPQKSQWHMNVDTGTLLCDGTTHTHLLSQTMYRDFTLHVEWRLTDPIIDPAAMYNSGVFVRMVPGQRVMHQIETRRNKVGVLMGGAIVDGDLTYLGVARPGRSGQWTAVWPHIPKLWRPHISRYNQTPVTKVPSELGASQQAVVYPPGEWNRYDITCSGKTIVVRTNDIVTSVTDNCRVAEGAIGFESEGYPIEFRNMRLKLA